MTLIVAGEPTATADPGQRALDDPAFGEHHEAGPVAAANDLKLPPAGPGNGGLHLAPLVACIGDDALDEGEAPSGLPEERLSSVAVLHTGRVDGDGK